MAVIEYDEYKQKLQALEPTLGELEKALGIPKAREELAELQKETEQEGFWNDLERSQQVSRQVKRLENKIKKHDKLVNDINSLQARRAAVHAKVSVANAQQHVNEATEKTAKASRGTAAFERMEEKADRMLNEANATAELNTQASNEDIANKYLAGGSASVDDELARLKAEVGVEEQQEAASD